MILARSLRAKAVGRPLLTLCSRTGCWGKADDVRSQKSSKQWLHRVSRDAKG